MKYHCYQNTSLCAVKESGEYDSDQHNQNPLNKCIRKTLGFDSPESRRCMPNCPKNPEDKARTEGTELCLKSRQGKSTPTRFLGKPTIDNVIEEVSIVPMRIDRSERSMLSTDDA